jgi:hypothetical protein
MSNPRARRGQNHPPQTRHASSQCAGRASWRGTPPSERGKYQYEAIGAIGFEDFKSRNLDFHFLERFINCLGEGSRKILLDGWTIGICLVLDINNRSGFGCLLRLRIGPARSHEKEFHLHRCFPLFMLTRRHN